MSRFKSFQVDGLFGSIQHRVEFSTGSPVTILAGPNGCGKTHVLRLLQATLALDFSELFSLPYKTVTLQISADRALRVELSGPSEEETLRLASVIRGQEVNEALLSSEDFKVDESDDLPPWVNKVAGADRWYDERGGRYLTAREIERRFGISIASQDRRRNVLTEHPWLEEALLDPRPIFIDTKRLDTLSRQRNREEYAHSRDPRYATKGAVGRIGEYISEIRAQVGEARRESLARSQAADEKFAFNLLKRSRKGVKQETLVTSYERISKLNDELSANGLAGKAMSLTIPDGTNPTERRILDLFLQDWERKQAPLLPIHNKLTALKRIVDGKFAGKTISLDYRGGLHFVGQDGSQVQVDQLSSGEQHLLALFTLLLFSAQEGSTVLIDEPEISLHAAWKHAFITDIEAVAEIANLSVIFATHSTAIINGRWDLVQELGVVSAED